MFADDDRFVGYDQNAGGYGGQQGYGGGGYSGGGGY
jgi:hypothetical protein